MAAPASGSVGETTAPRANAAAQQNRGERERPQAGADVVEVREEGRGVQQRRQEDHEDDLGVELDLRQPGDEAHRGAADHQHDRVRDRQLASERAQARDGDQEPSYE